MPANAATGRIPLKDGAEVLWTREELPPTDARAFRLDARLRTYRVTTVGERADGGFIVGRYDIPGTHLHAFLLGDLYDWGPGEGHSVRTVEALPGPGQ